MFNLPPATALLVYVFILFGLSACSDNSSDQVINFGLSTEPITLDPRFATDAVSDRINRLLYASLIDFDDEFHVIPDLASWEKKSNFHYQFKLQEQQRLFHDGTTLTAADVKATYESVLKPSTASPHASSLSMIDRIEAPDRNTVDFYLKQADPLFPGRLTLRIFPKRLLEKDHPFNQQAVGSGPFKLLTWEESGVLTLVRVSDQQMVKLITVKDPTVRVLKLLAGELDLFQGDIPFEMLSWVEKQAGIDVENTQGTTFSYLGFNLQDPLVGQKKVRRAIALSIDRAALIEHIFKHSAQLAHAMFTEKHWASAKLNGFQPNLAEAKQLLSSLGFSESNPLKITYKTSNNPFRIRLATAIQHQLKQVNIEVKIQSYDWGTFYGDIKEGNFQMYSLAWVGLKLPDIFRYVFHSTSVPPAGANRGRYSSTQLDQLIERAEVEPDLSKQAKIYQQLQAKLLEELPYVPLWYENNFMVKSQKIRNYKLSIDGNYDGLIDTVKVNEAD